jgi:hypothetical protein
MFKFAISMTKALRINILLLTTTYFLLSVGFGVSTHYCHDNLKSVSYFAASPDCECGDELSDLGCCRTVEQLIQLDDESILPQLLEAQFAHASSVVEHELRPHVNRLDPTCLGQACLLGESGPPIYIINSSLIFYA